MESRMLPNTGGRFDGMWLLYSTKFTEPSFIYIPILNIILNPNKQSILQHPHMSDSLGLRRKRTATERAEKNADPLVIRKKAREAAKSNVTVATVSTEAGGNINPVNSVSYLTSDG